MTPQIPPPTFNLGSNSPTPAIGTTTSVEDKRSDTFLLVTAMTGLAVLGIWSHQRNLALSRVFMAAPQPLIPGRTNQQIFEAALARYRQGAYSENWRFDLVDALLQEGARTRVDTKTQKTVINMMGIDASKLKLHHIDFGKSGHQIDFTGSDLTKLDLEGCEFINGIFDGVKMREVDFTLTNFTSCRFGRGFELSGNIRGKQILKPMSQQRLPLGLNDELIEDEEAFTQLYSSFNGCEFGGGASLDKTTMNAVQFVGSRFRNVSMRMCNLGRVNFEGVEDMVKPADMTGVIFDLTLFSKISMTHIRAVESSFRGCFLSRSEFRQFQGVGLVFDPLTVAGKVKRTELIACYIGGYGTSMTGCSFRSVRFAGSEIASSDFESPLLFESCNFIGSEFFALGPKNSRIICSAFRRCNLTRVYMDPGCLLGYPYMPEVTLLGRVIFDSCDFTESIFRKIEDGQIVGAMLGADRVAFRGWNIFHRAQWEGVRMPDIHGNAQVGWAPPIEGDFTGAHLNGADLFNRHFGESIFDGTELQGAGCQYARFRRTRRLDRAIVDDRTQLSRALLPKYARYSPIGKIGAKQGANFS